MSDTDTSQVRGSDLIRIEKKLDDLAEAIKNLIRLEVQQNGQAKEIAELQTALKILRAEYQNTKALLDTWITRGITAWCIAILMYGLLKDFNFISLLKGH